MSAQGPRIVVISLLPALALACGGGGEQADRADAGSGLPPGVSLVVSDVGFATPESIVHDPVSDVYLVSNVNGNPLEKDGNGFISRLSPEGDVLDLRWIDGEAEGVSLDAPKGLVILEGNLYVADIDCVRVFALETREQREDICFPDATFLNDVSVDQNGTLYVTDSGYQAGPEGLEPSGTDAVYRFSPDGRRQNMVMSTSLGNPNGIFVGSRGIMVVTFGTGEIYRLAADAKRTAVLPPSDRRLDGIVFTNSGEMVFSDWAGSVVYRVTRTGALEPLVESVPAPADIGYDGVRDRILIPLFNDEAIWVVDLN
jgi:sugar lactone lactonase YvrE